MTVKRLALILSLAAILFLLPTSVPAQSPQLDDSCVVSAFNRTAPVQKDGSWVLPNVPANVGRVRVRATCVRGGVTTAGQSDFITVPANGVIQVVDIVFDAPQPIPESLALSAPKSSLGVPGETLQLTAIASFPDGSTSDVTLASDGIGYRISNSALATISPDGLITAQISGNVLVNALFEGALGVFQLQVVLSGDSDGDGLPDDFEIANGLDPNNPADVLDDQDNDGLSTLDEFNRGLDPFNPDTDGDGLLDGEEVNRFGTDPLLFDTDGDGISDGLEIQSGSDPLDPNSFNLQGILESLTVTPTAFTIVFDTVAGEASRRLEVVGQLIDGTSIDLRRRSRGTAYSSSNLAVANFGAEDGRVFAGQNGTATVTVSNAGFTADVQVSVETFSPVALSSLRLAGFANGIDVAGDFAYIAAGSAGLHVVDISELTAPVLVSTLDTVGNANDVVYAAGRVYLADGPAGLAIVDVSLPAAPVLLGSVDTPGNATDLRVQGGHVFVADGTAGLTVIDASSAALPILLTTLNTPGNARGIDLNGGLAAIADDQGGLQVVDISNPAAPVLLGATTTRPGSTSRAADVALRGTVAFVADGSATLGGLRAIDLRVPSSPAFIGTTNDQFGLTGVVLDGRFALTSDYFFANAVPIFEVGANPPVFAAVLNFAGAPSFRDDNGNNLDVQNGAVFLVGTRGAIQDNGVWGDSALHIGRYRSEQDLGGIAPTVTITAPLAGASAPERSPLRVKATAIDDIRVVAVEFSVDGTVMATDFKAPYEAVVTVPDGQAKMVLGASALDLAGNRGLAPSVEVFIIEDDSPVVSLLAPVDGNRFVEGATIDLIATASDDVAIASVRFVVNGVTVGTRVSPPYQVTYNIPVGATALSVSAVATDSVGQTATSDTVLVGVDDDLPPFVTLLQPADGDEVVAGGSVRVIAGATDDRQVTRVRFFLNGAFFGEDFQTPYESTLPGPTSAGQSRTVTARAEDNLGQSAEASATVIGVPDPGTAVAGTVLLPDRGPAAGATVDAGGQTGLTDGSGGFLLTDVATASGEVRVRATLELNDEFLVGFSTPGVPVPGGLTQIGEIVLFPGFPNGNGSFETGDFTGFVATGQTAVLSALGPVLPTEGAFMGFLSTGSGSVGNTTSTIRTIGFTVPSGVNFLAFDFNFLSNEFPSFVGSIFNDTLLVRLTTSEGSREELLGSVNTSSFIQAPGTGFNGMTGFGTLRLDVSEFAGSTDPCVVTFEIQVFDQGDTVVDSAGLIDNLRFE